MTRMVVRLNFDAERRLGPGKIELLEMIAETGSIAAAGRRMSMSYRRAWLLVDSMNRTFQTPVIATRLGGTTDGRAQLTDLGREVIGLFREVERAARDGADASIARLCSLLSCPAQGEKPPATSTAPVGRKARSNGGSRPIKAPASAVKDG